MGKMASQITGVSIVYSTVCSGVDQRKHQSSASLAFVKGIRRWPVNYPHKAALTRKIFLFDDVIMNRPRAVMEMKLNRECFGSFLSNWLKDSDFTFVQAIYSKFIDIFCGVLMFQKHFNISLKISSPYTKNMYLIKKWWHKRFHDMGVVTSDARVLLSVTGTLDNFMMTSSNGSIFRVTGLLCGEFTGPRWIPRTGEFPAQRPATRSFDVFFGLTAVE